MALIAAMPPAIIRPAVTEPFGIPEIYADGGVCRTDGPWTFTILYLRDGGARNGIFRIRMLRKDCPPEDGFEVSLIRAYLDSVAGMRH